MGILEQSPQVVVSIAPSFAAFYDGLNAKKLPSALRLLGFSRVEETSVGAEAVASYSKELVQNPDTCGSGICSACPVVVNFMEKYLADHLDALMPVVSPMVAHGKMIKQQFPDAKVVFIGPCIAKKEEAEWPNNQGVIDAVLTFTELDEWLALRNINIENCVESGFDNAATGEHAKLFALPGGLLVTAGMDNGINNAQIVHASGADNTMSVIQAAIETEAMEVIEPLFCKGGCINGPGVVSDKNQFERRNQLIDYTMQKPVFARNEKPEILVDLRTGYENLGVVNYVPTEQEIQQIYDDTGKTNPEKQLNCGACGYNSCRENAIAIINNMAEPQMCLPNMRRLAENRTDKIIETSPNGIVILDENLSIVSMNTSFQKFFMCTNAIAGKHISYLTDAKDFEKVALGHAQQLETIVNRYGKEFHQLVYSLPDEKQFVGIYVDISAVKMTEVKINSIYRATAQKAQKLLDHQIEMAQAMTRFLGESTATSEALLEGLIGYEEEE